MTTAINDQVIDVLARVADTEEVHRRAFNEVCAVIGHCDHERQWQRLGRRPALVVA